MEEHTMKPEIARLWAEALESGEYKQGRTLLHNAKTNEYCCLGVLCELAIQAGVPVVKAPANGNRTAYSGIMSYDGRSGYLPESVSDWAGLPTEVGDPQLGLTRSELATSLNDTYRRTFKEIAAAIRRTFLGEVC